MALTLISLVAIAVAQSEPLFVVTRGEKSGFVDRAGQPVIPFEYDEARPFSEGLAGVRLQKRWGYIGPDGKIVIEPRYVIALDFSGGLAAVATETNAFTFIDRSGNPAFDATFEEARSFSDGLAAVRRGTNWWFVDAHGVGLLEDEDFENVGAFAQGLAPVQRGGLWGYVTRKGQLKIRPMFKSADPFLGGYATARKAALGSEEPPALVLYRLTDEGQLQDMHIELDEGIAEIGPFSGGLAPARVESDWGFVDIAGRWRIPPLFSYAEPFRDGLARAVDSRGSWHYVDGDGHIAFQASDVRGLAPADEAPLIPLEFTSDPDGAEVYVISKRTYENHPDMQTKYRDWTSLGRPTNGEERVFEKKYKVAFLLPDKETQLKEVDVLPGKNNSVHAKF